MIQTKTSGIPVRIFVTDSGQTPVSREKCCVTPPCSLPQPREHESMICHFCSLMLFLCCSGEPRSHLVFDRVTFCSCLSFYLEGNRCIFDLHFSIVQFSDSGTLWKSARLPYMKKNLQNLISLCLCPDVHIYASYFHSSCADKEASFSYLC